MRKVRPWKWIPFTNPARKDDTVFYHWRRVADEGKEYPFAKFNKASFFEMQKIFKFLVQIVTLMFSTAS